MVFKNIVILSAFLLMVMMVKATVIGGGANGTTSAVNDSVLGCDGGTDQQAKGVKVKCIKPDGTEGKQCVTEGKGDVCDLKVIECQ